MAVIGHVDAGKSTTTGQILYQNQSFDKRKLDKLKKDAEAMGRGSFALAHCTDSTKEEQERGITINSSVKKFKCLRTDRHVTIVDAPGHRQFINNMISGAAQCNYALLVVSAKENEKAAGLASNGQTMEHVMIVQALGVKQVIIAVNKMDDENINYSQNKYEETVAEVLKQYKNLPAKIKLPEAEARKRCAARKKACEAAKKKVVYKFEDRYVLPVFVPISGFSGTNILERDTEFMPWYNGPSLMELIEQLPDMEYDLDIPFRVMVNGLSKISGIGKVVTGKVLCGELKVGDQIEIQPVELKAEIKSIEKFNKAHPSAQADDQIGMTLKGLKDDQIIRVGKGCVIGSVDSGLTRIWRFKAEVVLCDNMVGTLHAGFKPVLNCGSMKKPVQVIEVLGVKNSKMREYDENKNAAKAKEQAICIMQTEKGELVLEENEEKCPFLNRFALRNGNMTIGFGKLKAIENDKFVKDFRIDKKAAKEDGDEGSKKGSKKKK